MWKLSLQLMIFILLKIENKLGEKMIISNFH